MCNHLESIVNVDEQIGVGLIICDNAKPTLARDHIYVYFSIQSDGLMIIPNVLLTL